MVHFLGYIFFSVYDWKNNFQNAGILKSRFLILQMVMTHARMANFKTGKLIFLVTDFGVSYQLFDPSKSDDVIRENLTLSLCALLQGGHVVTYFQVIKVH